MNVIEPENELRHDLNGSHGNTIIVGKKSQVHMLAIMMMAS